MCTYTYTMEVEDILDIEYEYLRISVPIYIVYNVKCICTNAYRGLDDYNA